ncbi:uncharacterized protein LOC108105292 [Drosophila eugracilis]|uniref:uncharacterized protein LOC108105292 n=1 Tax=Drosophila eugracilis TaxID=29029 RepID=UPI001BDABC38|nr:uncharacterized protein LOC108105292 [Drosophila eugracilis]
MSEESDVAALNIPEYCNFFKTLLVEELQLAKDYRKLHYGKCAIIGRLAVKEKLFYLENVRVKGLPATHCLPGGTISLLILGFSFDKVAGQRVTTGCYCIVRGEAALCNVLRPNSPLLSSRGVNEQLSNLSHDPAAQKQLLTQLSLSHKPAIDLWSIQSISHPEDLLSRRLDIRGHTVR